MKATEELIGGEVYLPKYGPETPITVMDVKIERNGIQVHVAEENKTFWCNANDAFSTKEEVIEHIDMSKSFGQMSEFFDKLSRDVNFRKEILDVSKKLHVVVDIKANSAITTTRPRQALDNKFFN